MRLDYVHPFVDSAVHVLIWLTGAPIECSAMELRRSSLQCKEVAFMIKVTGEAEARVNLEMNRETALALAGSMSGMVLFFGFIITKSITRPLEKSVDFAHTIARGDLGRELAIRPGRMKWDAWPRRST